MKETFIICILVIFIYIFLTMNSNKFVLIEASNGQKVRVNDEIDQQGSANLLAEIIVRIYKLRNYLKNNKDKYPNQIDCIELLEKNLNEDRTQIYENSTSSDYTSYSVNKGEEIVFCLRSKKTNKLHDINLMMYVAIHEMAHIGCFEIGHTKLFKEIFAFYLKIAIELDIYKYDNYDENPVEYCGMILSSTII
jgi:predicted metal-dependent hydrolase